MASSIPTSESVTPVFPPARTGSPAPQYTPALPVPTPAVSPAAPSPPPRTDDARWERDERFWPTFDQAAIGIAHVSLTNAWLRVNRRFCAIVGYPREELLATTLEAITHPDDREPSHEFTSRLLDGELPEYTLEKRYVRKDGRIVWVELTVSLVRDSAGAPSYFIGFLQDITARKATEAALRESEERFRRLTEAAVEGVVIHDEVGILDANPSLARMFGYELPEVVGRSVYDFLAPESQQTSSRRVHADHEGPYEAVGVRRDGSNFAIEIHGRTSQYQGRTVRVVAVRDITDRKRAEDQERELAREQAARGEAEASERRAAFLADASRVLGASFDYQTTLATLARLAVPRLADYCTVDVEERDGSCVRVGFAHADPSKEVHLREREMTHLKADVIGPAHAVARVLAKGKSVLIRDVPDDLAGSSFTRETTLRVILLQPHSLVSVPIVSSSGGLGVLTLVMSDSGRRYDETDLALAEELARRAALAIENARLFTEAQRATRARDEMLGVVAHDLRNPLNTITMGAELLLEVIPSERAMERRHAEIVRRAADRMNRLIQDLLDVRRMDEGRLTVDPHPEPVASVVGDAVEMLRPLAAASALTLEGELAADLPRVLVDPARVQQVFSNLLGNAIKFTPGGGHITLRAERASGEVRFAVTDTGPGIPTDQVPHIFGRFWQGNRGDRRGIGLGLAIAKGIVEAHGGRIWVESRLGEGSTFFFTVPAVPTA
ncbi:MAG: PAS domain S-box protein [Gemmatimonadaceae bacterium]